MGREVAPVCPWVFEWSWVALFRVPGFWVVTFWGIEEGMELWGRAQGRRKGGGASVSVLLSVMVIVPWRFLEYERRERE